MINDEKMTLDCSWGNRWLEKITPFNGFDSGDPDNAMQNNYAWSMAEMGDYLYVGTGRNILYSVLKSGIFGSISIPQVFVPKHVDMNAEIWRYKKDGSTGWERVYKAPQELGIFGFRFMIPYTTFSGETALYAGCHTLKPGVIVLKSKDGENWIPLRTGIKTGNSTRAMVVHQGKLYMAVLPGELGVLETFLYVSADPENEGWELVDISGDPGMNPRGGAVAMLSFNNRLYLGTALPGGFELWRTRGYIPKKNDWKLVVDKGAGDALNEIPLTLGEFNNHIYIGTALFGIRSIDPDKGFVPPKGFDLVRVGRDDRWELIVGGPPIEPTKPATGVRGLPLSGYPSGFGNITNAYCWQIEKHDKELYLGTFDWSVLVPPFIPLLPGVMGKLLPYDVDNILDSLLNYFKFIFSTENPFYFTPVEQISRRIINSFFELIQKSFGFDFWKSRDGIHWYPISFDGLGNPHNYGLRKLFSSSNGRLYLGTANPFEGCEVWVKK